MADHEAGSELQPRAEQEPCLKAVVVAGDIVVDHHIYKGTRDKPDAFSKQGTAIRQEFGGANLLFRILERLAAYQPVSSGDGSRPPFVVEFGMGSKPARSLDKLVQSYLLLAPCPAGESRKGEVWRITGNLGYGESVDSNTRYAKAAARTTVPAPIVVLDDAALGFRSNANKSAWPEELRDGGSAGVERVVLKTCAPVAQGDLWRTVCQTFCSRLVVVVSASDLRREEVSITEGLSWERTAQDLLQELTLNKSISDLTRCQHLIVSLGTDGALWRSTSSDGAAHYWLVFDPGGLERAWTQRMEGRVWGGMSCMVAAVVAELAKPEPDIGSGIMRGLSAMRTLMVVGHGPVATGGSGLAPGFPLDEVVSDIADPSHRYRIAEVPVSVASVGRSKDWTIMSGSGKGDPLYGLARRVALFGTKALVDETPHAVFGRLLVVDRAEIESLRGLTRLIRGYEEVKRQSKPLSIAVFGAPGSGKSFTVKQIAAEALGRKTPGMGLDKVPFLEFNLSQFSDPHDLIGAFHQVRDKVLAGTTPVIFWDEFDSREYMWLQYLLAPMQDGTFQEGQVTHPIGKCVFVFAGGTSYDFANFAPREEVHPNSAGAGGGQAGSSRFDMFRLAKGPDFVSRLAGYVNVAGPNRRQEYDAVRRKWVDDYSDLSFPVRRALLMRTAAGFLGAAKDDEMDIDSGLLGAFLEVGKYAHGARSLETIMGLVGSLGLPGLRRSALPPEDQLSLHVDFDEFIGLIDCDRRFKMNSEVLAPFVHEFYRRFCRKQGWPIAYDVDYEDLPDDIKADNIAAAARIPKVLALVGLAVVSKDHSSTTSAAKVKRAIEAGLPILTEAEHDGWMEQKYRSGWSYGVERDETRKHHPSIVAYANLREGDKDKDRDSVLNYPKIVRMAGFKIVEAGSAGSSGCRPVKPTTPRNK